MEKRLVVHCSRHLLGHLRLLDVLRLRILGLWQMLCNARPAGGNRDRRREGLTCCWGKLPQHLGKFALQHPRVRGGMLTLSRQHRIFDCRERTLGPEARRGFDWIAVSTVQISALPFREISFADPFSYFATVLRACSLVIQAYLAFRGRLTSRSSAGIKPGGRIELPLAAQLTLS